MSLIINNPELEARLSERAAAFGVPLDAYAVEVLQEVLRRDISAQPVASRQPVAFSSERETRNAQIRALLHAPADVRSATLAAGARIMASEYRDNPELSEFTHALQGEDFHDD